MPSAFFLIFAKGVKSSSVEEKADMWLRALYKGEEWAYKVLFDQYFYALSSFAAKYVGTKEVAEDIVQDVLYDFWENRRQFADILALKSYLYRVVRNHCLNVLKHQRVEEKYFAGRDLENESDFFLNQILEEEVYLRLKEAVDALPEQTRQIYELTLLGHDNQEIADMLGLTLDAVKARKKRGKQLLQEKLKHLIYLFVLFS